MSAQPIVMRPNQMPAVLRALRQKAGISQRELGERCHLHQVTISGFETGGVCNLLRFGVPLADALGYRVELVLEPKGVR